MACQAFNEFVSISFPVWSKSPPPPLPCSSHTRPGLEKGVHSGLKVLSDLKAWGSWGSFGGTRFPDSVWKRSWQETQIPIGFWKGVSFANNPYGGTRFPDPVWKRSWQETQIPDRVWRGVSFANYSYGGTRFPDTVWKRSWQETQIPDRVWKGVSFANNQ